ncbi:MAG TPA: hypothetical protein VJK03_01585 [Candidatus Nanoarchaeia archaeon]|nr:hypothetical protein [Candidatus Nanoarchaeia archaeon]
MAPTILSHPLFVETILPFLLVFTLVFAILQKTEILGKGKRQIDAIVAAVIGLIVVSFGYATGVIVSLIPFMAVGAVVILVFLLLYGMVFEPGKFQVHKGIKVTVGILVAIGVIVATMIATGAWNYVFDVLNAGTDSSVIITNLVFIAIFIAAVIVVIIGAGSSKGDKKE